MKDKLEDCLRNFGSEAMSYSTLQAGMKHFFIEGIGYISFAFSNSGNPIAFALSNPVCAEKDYLKLTSDFLREYPNSVFLQAGDDFAPVLDKIGFYVNEMGVDTEIKIKDYSYSGRAKEFLRRNARQAEEIGVVVEEISDAKEVEGELEDISKEWIGTKIVDNKEIWFVARRAIYDREKGVRKFIAKNKDDYLGFVFFDPMYMDGKVNGYYADILRAKKGAHKGTIPLIIKDAMEVFRQEEVAILSLGISPFFNLSDEKYRHSRLMKETFKILYKTGNKIYPFKNLSFTKSRYGGGLNGNGGYRDKNVNMKKVYFAHKSRIPVKEIYEVFKLTGIIDGVFPTLKKLVS